VVGALAGMVGCGQTVVEITPPPAQYPCVLPSNLPMGGVHLNGKLFHAYGDSITYGFLLPSTRDAYPYLMAADLGLTVNDNAVNGAQACDLSPNQIFPNNDNPSIASPMLYTVMVGTNDAARDIAGYTDVFALCHQAAIAWLGVPAEFKVLANAPTVTHSGGGTTEAANNWNAWVMSQQGSSITLPITVSVTGPIYLWMRIIDGDGATYSYSVDGNILGNGSTSTTPVVKTSQSTTDSLALIRIPGISAGVHKVTVTMTSGPGTVRTIAAGVPPQSGTSLPEVLVGDIPYALNTASTGCSGTATASLRYIAEIQKTVILLNGDGLNVSYVPTRKFFFGTSAELEDQVHPNPFGQGELRKAYEASIY